MVEKKIRELLSLLKKFCVPEYAAYFSIIVISIILFSRSNFSIKEAFYSLLSFSFAIFGLNSFNQITDKKIDRISKPFRPLIKKEIGINQAWIAVFLFYITAIVAAVFTGKKEVLLLLAIFIFCSFIYSLNVFDLRRPFGSNIFGSFFYGFCPAILTQIIINIELAPVTLLLTMNAFFISSFKDFEDIEADRRNRVKTLPNVFGKASALRLLTTSLLAIIIIFTIIILQKKGEIMAAIFLVINLIGTWQMHKISEQIISKNKIKSDLVGIGLTYSIISLLTFLILF